MGAFWSPSTTDANFTLLLYIYIYIYKLLEEYSFISDTLCLSLSLYIYIYIVSSINKYASNTFIRKNSIFFLNNYNEILLFRLKYYTIKTIHNIKTQ